MLENHEMQQQPAPSQEEGVPPAAATATATGWLRWYRCCAVAAPAPTPTPADDDDAVAPPAPARAPLPLGDDQFPDEALAVVCSFLGLRELGRLASVARRFTEPTLTEPGGAQLLSPIEDGARLRLVVVVAAGGGGGGGGGASCGVAAVQLADETWMRALWRVLSIVQYRFTSCGPNVVLSEEGALRLRACGGEGSSLGTHTGSRSLRSCLPELQWARGGALRVVVAVTRPCCLSDSLPCMCLRSHVLAGAAGAGAAGAAACACASQRKPQASDWGRCCCWWWWTATAAAATAVVAAAAARWPEETLAQWHYATRLETSGRSSGVSPEGLLQSRWP